MNPKQEIFEILYQFKGGESVLDVGCGVPLPPILDNIHYLGIDLKMGVDWYDYPPGEYDIIIANDIFPNVDQRLELFLQKYLPHCKEMRLSLTYFDEPKWYRAQRVDGDEVLTILQWNENQINKLLAFYDVFEKRLFKREKYQGEFSNNRRVVLIWMKGDLA